MTKRTEQRLVELFSAHAPAALSFAYLLTGDSEEAEDLLQDAFVRLFSRFHDLRNPDAFDIYLRKTLINLSRDRLRRLKLERVLRRREEIHAREQTTNIPDIETKETIRNTIRKLPHRQLAALVLRYYEDLSERGIAEVLGCSVPAVKSLIARALTTLRNSARMEDDE